MPWVRAVKSFGGGGVHKSAGDEFELPAGADWLRAGLVERATRPAAVESAMMDTAPPKPVGRGLQPIAGIPGIGEAMRGRLEKAGIEKMIDLAAAPVDELTRIQGISAAKAEMFIQAAREALK